MNRFIIELKKGENIKEEYFVFIWWLLVFWVDILREVI